MKTFSRFSAFALLFVIVFTVPAYGWSDTGHMAVAYVAYRRLTPQTRARVDALVRLNPRFNAWQNRIPANTSAARRREMLFMIAATWPDEIKGLPGYIQDGPNNGNRPPSDGTADRNVGYSDMSMHKYWHFVDLPFSTDGTALADPPVPNAETMIAAFRAVLASDSPAALKSYDLAWLLHIVGDIHQPLHATARFTADHPHGDDGGNAVSVRDQGNQKRLHSFWDGLLGTSREPAVAINVGQGLPVPSVGASSNLSARDWINESFELAKSTVYRPPIGPGDGPFTITNSYRNSARALARKRVALGGARLANILNSELVLNTTVDNKASAEIRANVSRLESSENQDRFQRAAKRISEANESFLEDRKKIELVQEVSQAGQLITGFDADEVQSVLSRGKSQLLRAIDAEDEAGLRTFVEETYPSGTQVSIEKAASGKLIATRQSANLAFDQANRAFVTTRSALPPIDLCVISDPKQATFRIVLKRQGEPTFQEICTNPCTVVSRRGKYWYYVKKNGYKEQRYDFDLMQFDEDIQALSVTCLLYEESDRNGPTPCEYRDAKVHPCSVVRPEPAQVISNGSKEQKPR